MSLLCKIFGHQPPVYAKKGWYSPGEEYADEVSRPYPDGIGRLHCFVYSTCPRCKQRFRLCRIHLPPSVKESP